MNKQFTLFLLVACLFAIVSGAHADDADQILSLRKMDFDSGWVFQRGDHPDAFGSDFDDSSWNAVTIPHDWSIEGPIEKDNPSGNQGGFYPCGIGYYRKTFSFEPAWKDQLVQITFDGVMSNSEVWINGHLLGKRPNGYVGFTYDLTDHLNEEGDNVIAVRADNSAQPSSRWYTGCGIYRHVWLNVKNKVSVAQHGTYVVAKNVTAESAQVQIETTIGNSSGEQATVEIISKILDPNGTIIAQCSQEQRVEKDSSAVVQHSFEVPNPQLWSIESPQQYLLVTKLMNGDQLIDAQTTPFGIRDIRFEVETGFWLNGKNVKIKGVNNHHDGGPVGAAVPEDVLIRRLELLKQMGCNAIRTAHNPMAPEFYDLCDQMGFLVMDEVFDEWIASWPWIKKLKDQGKVKHGYHKHFEQWWERDLTDIILRDRNHPSIVLWSVGNEIPDQCYPEGPERLEPMMDIVRKLDSTRPITCGCCFIHLANPTGFASMLDVTGYNGGGGSVFYEKDKETYPNRKFIATEIPHSFQTRGIYKTKTEMRSPKQGIAVPDLTEEEVFPDVSPFYSSSYDNSSVRISARDSWRRTASLPYVAGEFRWTGFDYLGEAIKGWPTRFFNFGIIDVCGFPKDHFYFYQSQWTDKPMVHILPHWNWAGKEGTVIPVWTYSSADEVELFLNDQSLGAKSNLDQMNLSWEVPYAPGTLTAIATTDGKTVAECTIKTAGKPAKIEIIADKQTLAADGESCVHLEVNVLDKDGNFVPNANNLVQFNLSGPANNIGVDNGDPLDLASTKMDQRKAFNGKCLMILQAQDEPGQVTVEAVSQGLESAKMEISCLANKKPVLKAPAITHPPGGRIAIVADGNSPDPDDIGATAVMFGLLKAADLNDRLVHLSHSCDLKPTSRISAEDELRRQKVLDQVCREGVAKFGPYKNLANFFNCRTQQTAAVNDLRDAINRSTKEDPLWIIEAGEPDIIGFALKAAEPSKRQFVHVVSHHPANDNAGDFFKWQQILDFGVTEHQIGDQNIGLKTNIGLWDWLKVHSDPNMQWIWEQFDYAERDGVVKFQTGKFDCSDAGMLYWWITGAADGGNKHSTHEDIKTLLIQDESR